MSHSIFHRARMRCSALFLAAVMAFAPLAPAQARGISLVRDAEIEALVRSYALPLMRAAGLRPGSVRFYIVNDSSFNAFVSGTGLFVNTGLLLQAETPGEVIGVIAHELGHIVGGHQVRLRERAAEAARLAKIATLLGIGLGAAGAATGNSGVASAGFGVAGGGASIAQRNLLRYQRDEEQTADRTAIRLLRATKQSGAGMLETFRRLARETSVMSGRIDPYMQSHPAASARIERLRQVVTESPYYGRKDSPEQRLRHDLARAKLAAYVGGSAYARGLLAGKKLAPPARLYGRSIVTHLYGSPRKAIPLIDKLARQLPSNPYVQEMKGEIFLRSGQAAKAIAPFRKAVKLDRTKAGFLQIELGHALLEAGGRKNTQEAVTQLKQGLRREPDTAGGYQFLARAHAALGNEPDALMASAEHALRTRRKGQAKSFATRAQKSFKRGSPQWLRAQDIIDYR